MTVWFVGIQIKIVTEDTDMGVCCPWITTLIKHSNSAPSLLTLFFNLTGFGPQRHDQLRYACSAVNHPNKKERLLMFLRICGSEKNNPVESMCVVFRKCTSMASLTKRRVLLCGCVGDPRDRNEQAQSAMSISAHDLRRIE